MTSQLTKPRRRRRRRRFALALIAWVSVELTALVGLLVLASGLGVRYRPLRVDRLSDPVKKQVDRLLTGGFDYLGLDAELGWTVRRSGRSKMYRANNAGIRSETDYTPMPATGVLRIATFGDSFTHGDEVANTDTWQHRLERGLPRSEVLNLGVSAYGPGQSLLRFRRRGPGLGAHVVFIGYSPDNLRRAINVYRPFLGPSQTFPLSKPRFVLHGEQLELRANPLRAIEDYRRLIGEPATVLPELGRHDSFFPRRYQPGRFDALPSVRLTKLLTYAASRKFAGDDYAPGHEAVELTFAILKQFAAEVRTSGAVPIVLFFPTDFAAMSNGATATYEPLAARLRAAGIRILDPTEAFSPSVSQGDPGRFQTGVFGHYSATGHEIVAGYLRQWLRAQGIDNPAGARRVR